MKAKIIPTKANKIAIENALKQHRVKKKISSLLKDYTGKNPRLLKIKSLCK
jgi:hypothetical protein